MDRIRNNVNWIIKLSASYIKDMAFSIRNPDFFESL
jgi:hypothetical protein